MRRRFQAAVLLLMLAGLSSCASDEPSGGAPFEVPGEPVRTNEVNLPKSYKFSPAVIEIDSGATVTWTNNDNFPHNVHLLDGSDQTIGLGIGETGSITFEEPATIFYECSIHPQQMRGKIVVT
jgi:plastocyanin